MQKRLFCQNFLKIAQRGVHVEARLASLGITLPEPTAPKGNYVPYVRSGNTVFLAGYYYFFFIKI